MATERPLYRAAGVTRLPETGHAGLWCDKFCDQWRAEGQRWSMSAGDDESPKLAWIQQLVNRSTGAAELLREYAERMLRLTGARGGLVEVLVAESRFVTGLGRSHPVENGFAWHPTLGTPYLPGSSLKGLTLAWAREQGWAAEAARLLGTPAAVGEVSFLDAVPLDPVWLEADVMTPHSAGWTLDDPPGDWRSPTPIPFLTAAPRTSLLSCVLPRRPSAGSALETVHCWLRQALVLAGGGAKTAVGYGRFSADPARAEQLVRELADRDRAAQQARKREQAMTTPEGRWRLAVADATEEGVLDLVRTYLEAEPMEDPVERAALVNALRQSGYPEHWKRGVTVSPGSRTGGKRLKALARLLAQEPPDRAGRRARDE